MTAAPTLDDADRKILNALQRDCTGSMERLAGEVGLSKSAVWNRVQRLIQTGVIARQAAVLDPEKIGLQETFFVTLRTAHHNAAWLEVFRDFVRERPEITEAHRLAGTLDYLLKVQVSSTRAFDVFYKQLVEKIDFLDVSSSLQMEVIKDNSGFTL